MNRNFLYFCKAGTNGQIDAAHDVYCVPTSNLKGMTNTGTTRAELTLMFEPIEGQIELASDLAATVADKVVLTVAQDTADDVAKALIAAINAGPHASGGVITIADLLNQSFFNSNITDAAITVQTAAAA